MILSSWDRVEKREREKETGVSSQIGSKAVQSHTEGEDRSQNLYTAVNNRNFERETTRRSSMNV